MNMIRITSDEDTYPKGVQEALGRQPTITALGNLELLRSRPLALFCSVKCPGDAILRTFDLIRALRDAGTPMIGGFHSPMEKECLTLLIRGSQPVIVCPARGIDGMRISTAWKKPLTAGRLLALSPFDKKHRRVTADASLARNLFVAALADEILVAHAGAGSKTDQLIRRLVTLKKSVWTLDIPANEHLTAIGTKPLPPQSVIGINFAWKDHGR